MASNLSVVGIYCLSPRFGGLELPIILSTSALIFFLHSGYLRSRAK